MSKKRLEILVMRDTMTACREYLYAEKTAREAGDLVSSRYTTLRLELADRVVEFVPVGSLDFCIRGRAISSYTIASNVSISESSEKFLEIAKAAGAWSSK